MQSVETSVDSSLYPEHASPPPGAAPKRGAWRGAAESGSELTAQCGGGQCLFNLGKERGHDTGSGRAGRRLLVRQFGRPAEL